MGTFSNINIHGIKIDCIDYNELLLQISSAIHDNRKLTIAYANANTVNFSYRSKELIQVLNTFDITHPDGIGIYAASRFLYKNNGLNERFTGSDFYPLLWERSIQEDWKLYFFGHNDSTLAKIPVNLPSLKIAGSHNGYSFNDSEVITQINNSCCDILVIGLGTPLQESWVIKNRDKLQCKVIICVGEGIKVFAGEKNRGPVILRKFGLEWFWRLLTNPFKYFGRYIIGNPLFLYRIFGIKMRKLAE